MAEYIGEYIREEIKRLLEHSQLPTDSGYRINQILANLNMWVVDAVEAYEGGAR